MMIQVLLRVPFVTRLDFPNKCDDDFLIILLVPAHSSQQGRVTPHHLVHDTEKSRCLFQKESKLDH